MTTTRVPANIQIRDGVVPGSVRTTGASATALEHPLPFEIQRSVNFDEFSASSFGGLMAQYSIPYFVSNGLRVVAAYQVVEDCNFNVVLYMGPFTIIVGESIEPQYQTNLFNINGQEGDVKFVEWNWTIDDKYPIGAIQDIHVVGYWMNNVFGVGSVKWIGLYCLVANKARIGATSTGAPITYTPAYLSD